MSLIDDIVEINITKATIGLVSSGFDKLLILGNSKKGEKGWITRVKTYANLNEVLEDYANNLPEYLCAKLAFAQQPGLRNILIGQCLDSESFIEGYNKVKLEDNDFYGVVITSKQASDQLAIAEQIETEQKIFGLSNDSSKILDTKDTTDILSQFKALNRERSFTIYHKDADLIYPEAAWLGLMLTKDPGTSTWAYKTLSGFTALNLTGNNLTTIENKNGNYFVPLAGRDIMLNGKVASGEYIDIIQGLDWLSNEIKTQIASALVLNDKIPFTNSGISVIENMLRNSLNTAGDRDIIDKETIKVTMPDVRNINSADKQARKLPNVKFEAKLSGAIHKVKIQGTVQL